LSNTDTMTRLIIVMLVPALIGCSGFTNVKTTVKDPKGEVWTVMSKSDALVKIKKDGAEVEVDNRGKVGFWEGIMQYLLVKPEVKIQNKGD